MFKQIFIVKLIKILAPKQMLSTTYSVRTLAHLTPVCLVKKIVAQIQKEINFAVASQREISCEIFFNS